MDMRRFFNRQNLLLGFMVIAILYGLCELFPQSQAREGAVDGRRNKSEIKELTQLIATDPSRNQPSARDQYVISKAEAEWTRDPFYDRNAYRRWKLSQTKPTAAPVNTLATPVFNYTGYLEDKGKKIAIINGVEYMTGEPLDIEGYILQKITSSRVIIENRASRRRFNVPFQE